MSFITGALYAALIVYLGGWYVGKWQGNFSLLLMMLTLVTLAYWLAERFKFRPAREAAAANLVAQDEGSPSPISQQGITQVDSNVTDARESCWLNPGGSTGRLGCSRSSVLCS